MTKTFVFMAVALTATSAWLSGQQGGAGTAPKGYLTAADVPEVARIVPPAPETSDPRFAADMALYWKTRTLEGSPRWALAQSDDNVTIAGIFRAFRCALGVTVTQENAPKVFALVSRANLDSRAAANYLKDLYKHKRPFQVAPADVCVSAEGKAALEKNPDYPSGHTTASWETGLVLAELAPDAATGILARARAFGESRVICGVHNLSAVQAGWMTATSIFAAQNASAAFRADVEAARGELAALRKAAKSAPEGCASDAEVLSKSIY